MLKFIRHLTNRYIKNNESPFEMEDNVLSSDFECSLASFSFSSHCDDLFLNRFNHEHIKEFQESSGLSKALASKGFPEIEADIFKDDTGIHHFKLYSSAMKKSNLLVDLRLSEKSITDISEIAGLTGKGKKMNFLQLEWISLENPKGSFPEDHPQLPGQMRPGLGILPQAVQFMRTLISKCGYDGLLIVADHFHTALIYSSFSFYADPEIQGMIQAIQRDLSSFSLNDISWGFITNTIINSNTGEAETFKPSFQIMPVSKKINDYFNSKKYHKVTEKTYKNKSFSLDTATMNRKRADLLKNKTISEL
ncbi:MAG TPA: hypothetical protein PK341_17520 [Spirochaetota bacterium]|nr:hypothetical protein [Spirochaetota bacterium]